MPNILQQFPTQPAYRFEKDCRDEFMLNFTYIMNDDNDKLLCPVNYF